jgi:hypothetical protein
MLLSQFMWLWMSRSTYIAVFELVTGKRAWHKTPHGHAEGPAEIDMAPAPRQLEAARAPQLQNRQLPNRPGYASRPAPDQRYDPRWDAPRWDADPRWAPQPPPRPVRPAGRPAQNWEPDDAWRPMPGDRSRR